MAELEIDSDDPGQHKQVDEVRIGENVEKALPQRHPRTTNRGAGERELDHAAADLDFAPRSLDQQAPQVGRDNVDDVPLERLFFADSGTFPDRQLHPLISLAPSPTGGAAPIGVPGAIAAMAAASTMKVPAEAALAPEGET